MTMLTFMMTMMMSKMMLIMLMPKRRDKKLLAPSSHRGFIILDFDCFDRFNDIAG